MSKLGPEIVEQVVAACQAGAAEAAEALKRALDAEVQLAVGEAGTVAPEALPEGFDGPGLVIKLQTGDEAAVFVLPESTGLCPEWYAEPDPTGVSRLATLAQELGMLLLPEDLMPEVFEARRVESIGEALSRGGVAAEASLLPLALSTADGRTVETHLIWPAASPGALYGETTPADAAEDTAAPPRSDESSPTTETLGSSTATPSAVAATSTGSSETAPRPGVQSRAVQGVDNLPLYIRSLLRIRVPVMVTLASKRQSVGSTLELGPGSMIQFDKSCEELLELEVGNTTIGLGEAVKVGDKFGLRLMSLKLPAERFRAVRPRPKAT